MQDYRSYNDVLIRIRSAIDNKDGRSRHPVEAQINGSGSWRGQSVFEFGKLDPGTQLKQEYGTLLGQQLLNPSIARALEQAGVGQGKYVRIRLLLDDDADVPHFIRWERMYFRVGTAFWPVAISPTVPFSRYIPDERPDTEPPRDPVFRLLFVIANPKGLPEQQTIDVETEIAHLLDEFQRSIPTARFRITILAGRTALSDTLTTRLKHADWLLAGGNATLDNIGTWLHRDGGYHALHIVCHGNYFAGEERGVLALEDDTGALQEIEDYQLASWIHNRLQLVVFQACRTAAAVPEDSPPFTAIAPKVVRFGVPAVVAMQDFILMSDARAFSAAFYRALLRDGDVDAAVNEGRQAVPNAVERVDSTIPVLFMRLKTGRLWHPDPVREDVQNTLLRLSPSEPLPLKVVHHTLGLQYDPDTGPQGPIYELSTRTGELVDTAWLTCLTGPPGFDKTAELHRQFKRLAEPYLKGHSDTAPLLLGISDLAQWSRWRATAVPGDLRASLQSVARARDFTVPAELQGRTFVFLVEADQDLSNEASDQAINTLLRLLDAFKGSRSLMIYDQTAMSNLTERLAEASRHQDGAHDDGSDPAQPGRVQVLVVRPMEWPDLKRFLIDQKETDLADVIETHQLDDLTSAPWILARLREFAQLRRFPTNRADALNLIASSYLLHFDTQRAPRGCTEEALERIAWQIQSTRRRSLPHSELISILDAVRDRRDFRLSDLRDELIKCHILATSGEEDVRFSYKALQAYYAARYLQGAPMALLEDITATLGRYSRMRQWEDVFITLAGVQKKLEDRLRLLHVLLAGSSLVEGEQVFLAVRMYVEMADCRWDPATRNQVREFRQELVQSKVVRQVLDALIWRSRPDIPRPYSDRRQAAERLAEMRHPDAIRHLVALAVDQFPVATLGGDPHSAHQNKKFDVAGIRLIAVNGLLLQMAATENYVQAERPQLMYVIEAWKQLLTGNTAPLQGILEANDPTVSPIAAFALAYAGIDLAGPLLLNTYFYFERGAPAQRPDGELLWAITEVFGKQDANWLCDQVIMRWLKHHNLAPDGRLCYLIQKLGQAPPDSCIFKYLEFCLQQEQLSEHDRALRAFSNLKDPQINAWLIPLCQDIVSGNWDGVRQSEHIGLQDKPAETDARRLQQAALEVLRDIGDENSLNIVRDARLGMDPILFQLSYQVAEEIYWRLTGGLARESFSTASP